MCPMNLRTWGASLSDCACAGNRHANTSGASRVMAIARRTIRRPHMYSRPELGHRRMLIKFDTTIGAIGAARQPQTPDIVSGEPLLERSSFGSDVRPQNDG